MKQAKKEESDDEEDDEDDDEESSEGIWSLSKITSTQYISVSSWSVQFLKLFSLCLKIRICNRVSVEIAGKYCQKNKIVWVSPRGKFCSIFSMLQIIALLWFS